MRELLIEISFTFIESVLLYCMMDNLLACKFTRYKKIVFLGAAILIDTLSVQFCPLKSTMLRNLLLMSISWLIAQILYRNNFLFKIFIILLSNYIFIISDIIAGNLLSTIFKTNVKNIVYSIFDLTTIFSISSKTIAFALVFLCIRFFKKIDLRISTKYWVTMDLIIAFFIVFINFLMTINSALQNSSPYYSMQITRVSICFLLMSVFVIYLFGEICLFYQKERQRYSLDLKNKVLEQQLAFQETSASNIKKIRHDIKNNLANISYLLNENHIEESVKYINAITSALEATKSVIHCGNKHLDAMK